MRTPDSEPARWEKRDRRLLTQTRIFDLFAQGYRHPVRGTEREFVVVEAPNWVNVLALTPDHQLVLVTQFRYGIDALSLEIPGGVIDPPEGPLDAAGRELREETGYAGGAARLLGSVHPNPAFIDNQCHLVLIEDAVPVAAPAWDHDEEIAVTTAPVEEVFHWARTGRITHGMVLNALWYFEPVWQRMPSPRKRPPGPV